MSTQLTGQATEEQIREWKEKYADVYAIKFDDCISYVRKPNRKELSYLMTMQNDPVKLAETFMKTCHVGGSELIKTEIDYMLGASTIIDQIITVKKAELGKL